MLLFTEWVESAEFCDCKYIASVNISFDNVYLHSSVIQDNGF